MNLPAARITTDTETETHAEHDHAGSNVTSNITGQSFPVTMNRSVPGMWAMPLRTSMSVPPGVAAARSPASR